jgi:hypothetical protein
MFLAGWCENLLNPNRQILGWLLVAHQSIAELASGVRLDSVQQIHLLFLSQPSKALFRHHHLVVASLVPQLLATQFELSNSYVARCVTQMFHARLSDSRRAGRWHHLCSSSVRHE